MLKGFNYSINYVHKYVLNHFDYYYHYYRKASKIWASFIIGYGQGRIDVHWENHQVLCVESKIKEPGYSRLFPVFLLLLPSPRFSEKTVAKIEKWLLPTSRAPARSEFFAEKTPTLDYRCNRLLVELLFGGKKKKKKAHIAHSKTNAFLRSARTFAKKPKMVSWNRLHAEFPVHVNDANIAQVKIVKYSSRYVDEWNFSDSDFRTF